MRFKQASFNLLFLLTTLSFNLVNCGIFDMVASVASKSVCLFKQECCDDSSIPGNIAQLRYALEQNVFGQHIAIELVVNAIAAHWNSPYARKPLTMSFHGMTGIGKNYVSQIIAGSLYSKGMKSKYVHAFSPGIHFPEKDETNIRKYKLKLYNDIKHFTSDCPKQLFIFDEVDKMPPSVLDGIKTMIDYHENVEGIDYRQCIFIFLSNTGAKDINNHFISLWRAGKIRESIQLSDFETMISQGAFNEEGESFIFKLPLVGTIWRLAKSVQSFLGGFYRSETIKNNLIDHYVPFLPLEMEHVKLCIRLEFRIWGIKQVGDAVTEEIVNFIEWAPSPENKFAKTGCKRLSQKVAIIASRISRGFGQNLLEEL